MKKIIAALSALALLSGCGGETMHEASYYEAHKSERMEMLASCKERSSEDRSKNCINAAEANAKIKIKSAFEGFPTGEL